MTAKGEKEAGGTADRKTADDEIREARAGETGTTRFGFVDEDSDAKDKADTAQRRNDGTQEGAKE